MAEKEEDVGTMAKAEDADQIRTCHVCQAIVEETVRRLQPALDARTKNPLTQVVSDPCDQDMFRNYKFNKAQASDVCNALMDNAEDTDFFLKVFSKAVRKVAPSAKGHNLLNITQLKDEACRAQTKACVGISFSKSNPPRGVLKTTTVDKDTGEVLKNKNGIVPNRKLRYDRANDKLIDL